MDFLTFFGIFFILCLLLYQKMLKTCALLIPGVSSSSICFSGRVRVGVRVRGKALQLGLV